ncbi:MAG: hypothetical protein ACFHX7_05470 [Pseudomonadota bacterium]
MEPTRPGLTLTSPEALFACPWRELRSEVSVWEDVGAGLTGCDGFTRYWCPEALFDVYWIVEGELAGDVTAYLTDDLVLTGFRAELAFAIEPAFLKQLASHVGWVKSVRQVLAQLRDEKDSKE